MNKKKFLYIITTMVLFVFSVLVFGKDIYTKMTLYDITDDGHQYTVLKDKYGSDVSVFIPESYDKDKENKWVIFAHGSNGSNTDMLELSGENSLLKPLLDDGFIIFSPNYRDTTNWGNQEGIEDLKASELLANDNYSLEDKPYLILQSMGGVIGLNAISSEEIEPEAVVGIYPSINLEYQFENPYGSLVDEISKAFNIENESQFKEKTIGYNPINADDFTVFSEIPMLLIASYEDEVVNRESNTDLFSEKIINAGGTITISGHEGNHGDISAFQGEKIVDFLESN